MRRNNGTSITDCLDRQWAEMHRNAKIESMSRVLAYIFRFDGEEHTTARAKVLTADDWTLEKKIRDEAPGILHKLIQASSEILKRNPGIVAKGEHGLTATYIHAFVWYSYETLL
jgi:phage/plasmid-associated DNA primase